MMVGKRVTGWGVGVAGAICVAASGGWTRLPKGMRKNSPATGMRRTVNFDFLGFQINVLFNIRCLWHIWLSNIYAIQ